MTTLPELTENELKTIADAHKQLLSDKPEGQSFALDPSNPLHKELILTVLKAAGQTPDKYPHLYSEIEKGAASSPAKPDNMIIVDAGSDRNGNATATSWLSNGKGTLYSGAGLMVLDGETNELLAYGANTDGHSGFMSNRTNAQTAKAAGKSIRVLGLNHMVGHDGTVRFTAAASNRIVDSAASIPPVSAPAKLKSHKSNNYILIAVGRDADHKNKDADYFYTETTNMSDPNLIVPFAGSITLPYPVASGTTSADIITVANLYVDYANTGSIVVGIDSTYTTPIDIQNAITIGEDNLTLSWKFPYDSKTYDTTSSLVFTDGPANDKYSYFFFQFTVPVSGSPNPTNTYTFTVYSYYSGNPNQPFNGSQQGIPILPLQFWWHCLAEGTQVAMNDGSRKNIEALNNSHRVRSGSHGADLGVEATTLGHHEANASQTGLQGVYRLRTKDGKELIATGAHPVMTPNGAIMMCHLAVDDAVLVTEGVSAVAGCEAIDYSGMFYDLKLGNAEDRAQTGQNPACSFHANGIQVGDHVAMNN